MHLPARLTPLLIACLAMSVVACAKPAFKTGNNVDDVRLAEIVPGEHTRQDVAEILGSPSTVSTFKDDNWYYVSRTTQQTAFFDPEVLEQRTVVVSFDRSGVVESVREVGLEEAQPIEPVARSTPTQGNSLTIMQQLLSNVGRYETAQ